MIIGVIQMRMITRFRRYKDFKCERYDVPIPSSFCTAILVGEARTVFHVTGDVSYHLYLTSGYQSRWIDPDTEYTLGNDWDGLWETVDADCVPI